MANKGSKQSKAKRQQENTNRRNAENKNPARHVLQLARGIRKPKAQIEAERANIHLSESENELLVWAMEEAKLAKSRGVTKKDNIHLQLIELANRLATAREGMQKFALSIHQELGSHGVTEEIGNAIARIRALAEERNEANTVIAYIQQELSTAFNDTLQFEETKEMLHKVIKVCEEGLLDPEPVEDILLRIEENITLFGEQFFNDKTTNKSKVLVTNQTNPEENGAYQTSEKEWSRLSKED